MMKSYSPVVGKAGADRVWLANESADERETSRGVVDVAQKVHRRKVQDATKAGTSKVGGQPRG